MAASPKNAVAQALTVFETSSGQVALSAEVIKKYLVNGNGNVTDQEVMMFLNLCKYQKLNPFLREAYLIKYGNAPAQIVVGKEAFTRRAENHEQFDGMEAGVVVQNKQTKVIDYRPGTLLLPDESLVGGWAKVYRRGWSHAVDATVSLTEYMQMKDGKPAASWAKMPATMIRKVAVMQALREAFPNEFGGMYGAEEMPVDSNLLPNEPITIDIEHQPALAELSLDKQKKIMFVQAEEASLSTEDLKLLVKQQTGKTTTKELTLNDIEKCLAVIDEIKLAKMTVEDTEPDPEMFREAEENIEQN